MAQANDKRPYTKGGYAYLAERHEEIVRWGQTMTPLQIHVALGRKPSLGVLYMYLRAYQIPVLRAYHGHRGKWTDSQLQTMLDLTATESMAQIGERFGITRERVRQLLAKIDPHGTVARRRHRGRRPGVRVTRACTSCGRERVYLEHRAPVAYECGNCARRTDRSEDFIAGMNLRLAGATWHEAAARAKMKGASQFVIAVQRHCAREHIEFDRFRTGRAIVRRRVAGRL